MQDLINKIQELRDLMKALAMKPKSAQQGLVPAIKAPSVKPLAMPSMSSGKPAELPGISTPSTKDPKKVAEQLKNPKSKKPKIEMLKFDKNGQWSLEKE